MSEVKKFPQEQVETIMAEGEQVLDLACAFGWTRPEPGAPASIELCRTQAAALPITDDGDFTVAKSAALDVRDVLEAIQCRRPTRAPASGRITRSCSQISTFKPREVTNMSIELTSVSVQENLGESGLREKRRADYRNYLLRLGPTSKTLCHMRLGAHMDALQAAFEHSYVGGGLLPTLAEYAADDILTVLSILRLDETSDEPPEEKFADDPAMVERLKGATFEKWYEEHCDVQPYFNGHDASPQGYLASDLAHLSEWPKFETKAEWVAWCCEKGKRPPAL